MPQQSIHRIKDIGTNRQVFDALPYAVVGGSYDGTLWDNVLTDGYAALLNHVVPAGQQLKLLFLRITTTDTSGARFSIVQTNPTASGQTGTTEAYPVMGSVPDGVRDYPMLEASGAEVLHGSLRDPIHVFEGSVEFRLEGFQVGPSSNRYGVTWWGVEKVIEG